MIVLNKIKSKFRALLYILGPKYRKSYSQCGEDIIIARILRDKGIQKPFYIDIGANDPVIFNNTYFFYKKGARGLCVEPNLVLCNKLRNKRPGDMCLQIGVGIKSGYETFIVMDRDVLSTFSRKEADEAIKMGYKIVLEIKIPVKTIEQIVEEYKIESIDVMSLDVEGLDFEILKNLNFIKIRPKILCVEMKSFGAGQQGRIFLENLMKENNYEIVGITPINAIYADIQSVKPQ